MNTRTRKSRYRTNADIRNSPRDELERELQRSEVERVSQSLLDRFAGEPEFFEQVIAEAAKQILDRASRRRSRDDENKRDELGRFKATSHESLLGVEEE